MEEKIDSEQRNFFHVHRFETRSDIYRQGVGKLIYEAIRNEAIQRHLDRIELNVFAFNTGAKAFYEEVGLVPKKINMKKIYRRKV